MIMDPVGNLIVPEGKRSKFIRVKPVIAAVRRAIRDARRK